MNLGAGRVSAASHREIQKVAKTKILFEAGAINGDVSLVHPEVCRANFSLVSSPQFLNGLSNLWEQVLVVLRGLL